MSSQSGGDDLCDEFNMTHDDSRVQTASNTTPMDSSLTSGIGRGYKRSSSIPIDLLETRRTPSVVELDLIRKLRQQDMEQELLRYRDLLQTAGEPMWGSSSLDSANDVHVDQMYRLGPRTRLRSQPPTLSSFISKNPTERLILPMKKYSSTPPKFLIPSASTFKKEVDDNSYQNARLAEIMMSPDSDRFLLSFPTVPEDDEKYVEDGKNDQDFDNEQFRHLNCVSAVADDELFILDSSISDLTYVRADLFRSKSASPTYTASTCTEELSATKTKITLKPKLRSFYPSVPTETETETGTDSLPKMSKAILSRDIPFKPRVCHHQSGNHYDSKQESSDSSFIFSRRESSVKDTAEYPPYSYNLESPFRQRLSSISGKLARKYYGGCVSNLLRSNSFPPSKLLNPTPTNSGTSISSRDCDLECNTRRVQGTPFKKSVSVQRIAHGENIMSRHACFSSGVPHNHNHFDYAPSEDTFQTSVSNLSVSANKTRTQRTLSLGTVTSEGVSPAISESNFYTPSSEPRHRLTSFGLPIRIDGVKDMKVIGLPLLPCNSLSPDVSFDASNIWSTEFFPTR